MEGLFEVVEGVKGNHEAYQADNRGGLDNAQIPLQELEGKSDRNNHAPDEIRDGGRDGGPQVSAELFRCDSNEYGPVTYRKPDRHAIHIKERRANPAEHEINGNSHPGKDLEHKNDLFSASNKLAQKPARKIAEHKPEITKHHRFPGIDRTSHPEGLCEFRGEGNNLRVPSSPSF